MQGLYRYYFTIRDLKWIQIKYQLLRRLLPRAYRKKEFNGEIRFLKYKHPPFAYQTLNTGQCFTFLNIEHCFTDQIDWHYQSLGKLWNFNLNYFDFLKQDGLPESEGKALILSWIEHPLVEAYPTSLRLINWIYFLSKFEISDQQIIDSIYSQTDYLSKNLEFHLMGNHLLENGFALLVSGCFLKDQKYFAKGQKVIQEQLTEQVLNDGGHFELSPMYHKTILGRVLEIIEILSLDDVKETSEEFTNFMKDKASIMLGWLKEIQFENGDVPHVNDSTNGIAPSATYLFKLASALGVQVKQVHLSDSGYRKLKNNALEVLFDVGEIGPHYIPGHAHSDTLNVILYIKGKPVLVDRGISTYEKNLTRKSERSTRSHNTVVVESLDQSEVWGGFRMARKAKINDLEESNNVIKASHDGYDRIGSNHERLIRLEDAHLVIEDKVKGGHPSRAFFHFHPSVNIMLNQNVLVCNEGYIEFENAKQILIEEYQYAEGFNKTKSASVAVVLFNESLITRIRT